MKRSGPPMKRANESPLCRHFLQGHCNYGALCKFIHEPEQTRSNDVCKHFKRGRCALNEECRFKHEGTGGTLPVNNSLKYNIMFHNYPLSIVPTAQDFAAGEQLYCELTPEARSTVCRHFLKNRCTFEGRCRYEHPQEHVHHQTRNKSQSFHASHQPPALEQTKRDQTCRHFIRGRCIYGSLCSFEHPQELAPHPDQQLNMSLKSTASVICRHFIRNKCYYGARCSFLHPIPDGILAD